jgi:hypothetical protein
MTQIKYRSYLRHLRLSAAKILCAARDAAHLMLSRGGEEIPLVPKAVETLRVFVVSQWKSDCLP